MKNLVKILIIISIYTNASASELVVENSYIRMMPPNAKMTAGYFIISNKSDEDMTLLNLKSDKFKSIEMHNTIKDGDVMKMVKQNSLVIPAKSQIEFKPMSYHLMLMGPTEDMLENKKINIIFEFINGKKLSAVFLVKKMQKGKNHDHSHHKKMKHKMSMMKHNMGMMKNMKRPDYVYPVGVKGGKNMMAKKIMFGYKYGVMEMDCCKDGTSSATESFIQGLGYSMTPLDMTMDMHMFSAMYAYSNKLSLMAMIPYIEKEMEMKMLTGMMAGKLHKTSSRGFGDLSIAGLYKLSNNSNLKLALSIPTGEYDEKDHNMSGVLKTLPYPMQIGSGTYDLTLGYSFQEIFDDWSYGFQANILKRFDYNSEGWKYGDSREASAWVAKPINNLFSLSFGLDIEHKDNIKGRSSNRMTNTPTWNEYFHSHLRVTSNIGINFKLPKSNSRIGFQCGTPIYYAVNGPQMDPDFKCNIGFSKMM